MSWVQQVHNAAVVARSLRCQCHGDSDTEMLKILGSEVPRSTAVLCTDSLVARLRGTEIRREGCSYAFLIV